MKIVLNKIVLFALLAFGAVACKKEFTDDLVKDSKPDVAVTFVGATTSGFNPYYKVSLASGGAIKLELSIPSNASRKIKSVTKIIAGATAINVANLKNPSYPSYLDAAVDVNGTTYTLNTTVAEFNSKAVLTTDKISLTTGGERAFLMLLTMDDNSEIIPVQCRIRVTPQ
jgi:hypothetical protein